MNTDAGLDLLPAPGTVPVDSPAMRSGDEPWIGHGALRRSVERAAAALAARRRLLVLVVMAPSPAVVVGYLAALKAGHAVLLLDASREASIRDLVERYRPDLVLRLEGPLDLPDGYNPEPSCTSGLSTWRRHDQGPPLHPDLALLLTTSGSLGSPRLVRLSHQNLAANTKAIIAALGMGPEDRAVGHLPPGFAFGLSVLNTHLSVGAAVLFPRDGLLSPGFWASVRSAGCTTFPGVPFHLEALLRLGIERLEVPSLRTILQAGGGCPPDVLRRLHAELEPRGGRVFAMYGQTEASPRMSVLPARELSARAGSVGPAIGDGRFEILLPDGRIAAPGQEGQIVYHGANVMLGYADDPADLASGDGMGGRLPTADIGFLDAVGYLTVRGRGGRIAKVFGVRVSLDEAEMLASRRATSAALEWNGRLVILVAGSEADAAAVRTALPPALGIPASGLICRAVPDLPRLPAGKPDYRRMTELAACLSSA